MPKQQKLIKDVPTLWRPEFIPFYPEEKARYGLNDRETIVYGFVRHFLKNCSGRFFFTNEQLRYVLVGVDRDKTISSIVGSLARKCPEITLSYSIKKDGGKVRSIHYSGADFPKTAIRTSPKPPVIENTINNTREERDITKEFQEISDRWVGSPNITLLQEEKSKFLSYWLEKSPNGKKCRWEMEKVFDVKRRWSTWIHNVEKRQKPVEYKKEIDTTPRSGFGCIGDVLRKKTT